jgi:hydroxymethylpyrimidine/phosphomethylpyrimidine kinase
LIPRAMTIAGSDSGGGAGIQADLKTFAAFEVYGASVITAVTAQNTRGVVSFLAMPPELVAQQIDAVLQDIGADAVKTGMLANADVIKVVADKIASYGIERLVVDPVMLSKSGHALLQPDAITALRTELLPLTHLLTPNIPEASALTGRHIGNPEEMSEAAQAIVAMGPKFVLIKGGHLDGDALDVLYDGTQVVEYREQRIHSQNTHGTGCTLSAAITAGLARGLGVAEAVAGAKEYITGAIRCGFSVGGGHSPVHHFYKVWRELPE